MNHFRLLAIGIIAMLALAVAAQNTATATKHGDGMPTAEDHLRMLTERLDLTSDQQAKIKPILQEMQDATIKLKQDDSMSREERSEKMRAC
ncbi:MAG TPA: hypothetical protein VI386_09740, partial [Candidatus Sulfotelmatobacter sp.]